MTKSGFNVNGLGSIPSDRCFVVARSAMEARRIAAETERFEFLGNDTDVVARIETPLKLRLSDEPVILDPHCDDEMWEHRDRGLGWWWRWCRNPLDPDVPTLAEVEAAGQRGLFGAAAERDQTP